MITLPTPVVRFGHKFVNWTVKNGPRIMSVVGGGMAIGGAVMACNATLHADEVFDRHKQKMAKIQAAIDLQASDEAPEGIDYGPKEIKHDKAQVYFETSIDLVKLYGPAVAVGLGGVGLMQGAFGIMDKRQSTAVAALTALDRAFQGYKDRVENEFGPEAVKKLDNPTLNATEKKSLPMPDKDGEVKDVDAVVLDKSAVADPFFFIFDETNPNWYGNNGYLLNERFLEATIDAFNYKLQGRAVDHVWMNDILKHWGMPETEFGQFYGWTVGGGDVIEYEIIPYLYYYAEDSDKQFPMLVETTMDNLRELEMSDIQQGYCIGVRLMSSTDGEPDLIEPRMIYNEVYNA